MPSAAASPPASARNWASPWWWRTKPALLARELGPKGIHVAHFVIDGAVRSERRPEAADRPDSTLSPDGIAQTYLDVLRQPRDAWSFEVELRPWVEKF